MGESGLDREAAKAGRVAEAQRALCAPLARAAEVHAVEHAESFVGLTEAAARERADELGLILRVVPVDAQVVVADSFAYGRVTAYTRAGTVTRTTAG